ncbi:MAG: hypothetical protein JO220_20710 [Hyphomicrobiales bacterium]|nr:hypothetical protein [Hyphomicrobiales bacterium]
MINNIQQVFPLTEMQKGMLFHSVMEPSSGIYCEQFLFEIKGEVDGKRLEAAWAAVVGGNDILRISTRYSRVREPVQIVHGSVLTSLPQLDLSGFPSAVQDDKLERLLAADREKNFDLARPELIRAQLLRMEYNRYILLLTYHHMLLDAWSLFLVMKELIERYETGTALESVKPYYSDYVASLRSHRLEDSRAFWRKYLDGYRTVTSVADRPSGQGIERNSLRLHKELVYRLPSELSEAVVQAARDYGHTLNTVLQAAWGLVVSSWSGEDDVVFGITITHRPYHIANIDKMVGIFINSLPKRLAINGDDTIRDYLGRVYRDQAEIKAHEHVPLPEIQKGSQIPGGVPIFETLLIFENFLKDRSWQQARDFTVDYYRYVGWTNYPLAIEAMPPEGHRPIFFQVKYDTNYFSADRVNSLLDLLRNYLETFVQGPDRQIDTFRRKAASGRTRVEDRPTSVLCVHGGPEDALCGEVRAIWSSLLNSKSLDDAQSFFEAGGHSLLLFELQTRLYDKFGIELSIVDLFDNPTVELQAQFIFAAQTSRRHPIHPQPLPASL